MKNPFKGRYGPLLIAEIGGNHEGNFEYAKALAKLAIETQVDYVKFQIYSGDTLVSEKESPDRNKHFKKFELTREQHRYLASMVKEAGLQYTSSVWDVEYMSWIDEFMSIYKIGSGDLTAYPLLEKIARKGKPIVISTGLATEREVLESIAFIQSVNADYKRADMLGVLQCTSMYPIAPADANLYTMNRFRELTGLTIGYSDHTEGSKALYYAVAMGAEILEFHFTDSREGKQFRDHKVSLTPPEVKDLIDEIQLIHQLQGSPEKQPVKIELDNGHHLSFRRAVYPKTNLPAGTVLTEDHLTVLRPNHGIDAREFEKVLGKKLKRAVAKHEKLSWDLLN